MKIAIVGTRGIPNRYGGFEQFAEKVSSHAGGSRARSHRLLPQALHRARRRVRPPCAAGDPSYRPSEAPRHLVERLAGSAIHVAFSDNDVVLMCNVANSPFAWIPRLFGKPVVLNVDGLDRRRGKWNALGQAVLHVCEWMSTFTPTRVVTDAEADPATTIASATAKTRPSSAMVPMFRLVSFRHRRRSTLHPVGMCCTSAASSPRTILNLCSRRGGKVRTDWPLVMVGDNRYDEGYLERLKSQADERVRFTGAIYGEDYWALQKHAGVIRLCLRGGRRSPRAD